MAADTDILAPGADEAYQLSMHGALRGDTFTILIARIEETVTLNAERDMWSVSPAKWSKRLSAAEWGDFLRCLHAANFWSMAEWSELRHLDATSWAIRGRLGKRQHSAHRWCPEDGAFSDLGEAFLGLAGQR